MPTKTPPKIPLKNAFLAFAQNLPYGKIVEMKWKEIVTDYLSFTRKERLGIITVLLIIIFLILLSIPNNHGGSGQQITDSTWIVAVKKLEQKENTVENSSPDGYESNTTIYQYDRSKNDYYNDKPAVELFYFDPNTLSRNGWQKLGLRDRTIRTIQNYLSKGGHFKKAEDLQRVYGLHKDEYERLAPFVKIENIAPENRIAGFSENKNPEENKQGFKNTLRYTSIDINTADTSAFISLPGIGSKLAARIVNFRGKLGGFYSVDQIRETFGLPDSTFQTIKQYLKVENSYLKKININTAGIDELKAHPYIKYTLANPIVAYRNQHGLFSNIEDLRKIMVVTDEVYKKIAPYLIIEF